MDCTYKAVVPRSETKTSRDYFWLLPTGFSSILKEIKNHTNTGFDTYKLLLKSIRPFYNTQVLGPAGVKEFHKDGKRYSMRTIRASIATKWVEQVMEHRVMEWKPEPPNPLQHEDWKTTLDNYAAKGCNNLLEANRRCFAKYGKSAEHYKTWMDDWKVETSSIAEVPSVHE